MKKIIIKIIFLGFIILTCMFEAFALQTYVGVKLNNLSDYSSGSCAGETGYGPNGRIRAISSILPSYPLYFELRNASNNGLIWSGNSTQDIDYKINDSILLPQQVDLEIGENYKLFFDYDAIKIFLPLDNEVEFENTLYNNYWTVGKWSTVGSNYQFIVDSSGCNYSNYGKYKIATSLSLLISNNRSSNNFEHGCMGSSNDYDCPKNVDVTVIGRFAGSSFGIDGKYNGLYSSTIGNVNIGFTFD